MPVGIFTFAALRRMEFFFSSVSLLKIGENEQVNSNLDDKRPLENESYVFDWQNIL
jgi:hypothetical protein